MFSGLSPHLPVILVVLPLIAAPICVIFRSASLAWLIALIASWLSFGISIFLLEQVISNGPISYFLGNWPAPWGIEYKVDVLSAFVMLIVTSIGAIVMVFAPKSVQIEIPVQVPFQMFLVLKCF